MFRPQLGHHQVTSRLYNRGSQNAVTHKIYKT